MIDIKRLRLSKQDMIGMVLCAFLSIGLLIISPYLPDERPEGIKREMKRQGFDVENVVFEFVRSGERYSEWIFESSEPLYIKGHHVKKTRLATVSFS